jgi:hypothetical protein
MIAALTAYAASVAVAAQRPNIVWFLTGACCHHIKRAAAARQCDARAPIAASQYALV